MTERIVIEPLTRVEGHGKVSILLDADHRVEQVRLHIVEFRGFERFIKGRPFWELPVIVQRLCGICPVSHHLCAAKAVDGIIGAEQLTPTGEKMRRLMHYGQIYQSHALHFFYLASPDLLFGFDAPVEKRNVGGVIAAFPELARQGVLMRKYGQEIIQATAGKKIHGTGAIPGGINKNLCLDERDALLREVDQMVRWAKGAMMLANGVMKAGNRVAATAVPDNPHAARMVTAAETAAIVFRLITRRAAVLLMILTRPGTAEIATVILIGMGAIGRKTRILSATSTKPGMVGIATVILIGTGATGTRARIAIGSRRRATTPSTKSTRR